VPSKSSVQRTEGGSPVTAAKQTTVDSEFSISERISRSKMMDYSATLVDTPQQLAEFVEPLADAGVDVFDCSLRRFWPPAFEGSDLNLADWVKGVTGLPTLCCGGVGLGEDTASFGDTGVYGKTASAAAPALLRAAPIQTTHRGHRHRAPTGQSTRPAAVPNVARPPK